MGYNLLLNRVYWGYNPLTNHLLTSWDIEVGEVEIHHFRETCNLSEGDRIPPNAPGRLSSSIPHGAAPSEHHPGGFGNGEINGGFGEVK